MVNKDRFTSDETQQTKRVRTISKGVNYKTGEDMREEYDSLEEMTEYFDKLIAEDYDDEI